MGGSDQTHRRRARISGVAPRGGDGLPFGKRWPRRQDGQRRCVRQADHAQGAVVRGMVRLLLRGLCPVVGVADRNVADRASADVQRRQRDRGEEKDLAPDGKQRRGKPDCRFQPLERDRVSLQALAAQAFIQSARVEPLALRRVAGKHRAAELATASSNHPLWRVPLHRALPPRQNRLTRRKSSLC